MLSRVKFFIGYTIVLGALMVAIVVIGTWPWPVSVETIEVTTVRPQIKIMDMRLTTSINGYDDFMLSYIIDGKNEFALCQTVEEVNATLAYLKFIGDIYEVQE